MWPGEPHPWVAQRPPPQRHQGPSSSWDRPLAPGGCLLISSGQTSSDYPALGQKVRRRVAEKAVQGPQTPAAVQGLGGPFVPPAGIGSPRRAWQAAPPPSGPRGFPGTVAPHAGTASTLAGEYGECKVLLSPPPQGWGHQGPYPQQVSDLIPDLGPVVTILKGFWRGLDQDALVHPPPQVKCLHLTCPTQGTRLWPVGGGAGNPWHGGVREEGGALPPPPPAEGGSSGGL